MTNEEAIERIKCILKNNSFTKADKNALKLTIEALEKQMPKKPTYEEIGNMYGGSKRTCAKCGDVCLISKGAKPYEHYCRYCGQALDWSDTK